MIKRIKSISNFGIYRDYRPGSEVHDFSKFNLFYGWNGSGKSTFSRFMQMLSKHSISDESEVCDFEVELMDGLVLSRDNLNDYTSKMFVFNQDFIKDNINWDEAIKSILLISEERIEDRLQLKNLNEELIVLNDDLRKSLAESKKRSREINKFLSETASKIKTQFQKIETDDKYYLNYNKTRVEKFLEININSNNKQILSHEEYDLITKAIKPVEKKALRPVILNFAIEELYDLRQQAIELLSTPYVSYSIEMIINYVTG
ncbi:AAA family ATPase [Paenibacillus frigoriresistens]|nr:AAA family ATPase [Paenibacillus frigoriresistens]